MKKAIEAFKMFAAVIAVALTVVLSAKLMGVSGVCLAAAAIGWVSSDLSAVPVKRGRSAQVAGAEERGFALSWAKKTTDGDGSIYYLAAIPASATLLRMLINCDALAGATSWSLGFYKLNDDGTISDTAKSDGSSAGAILMSAQDLHLGKALGSEQDGLSDMGIANLGKKVWELLGYTDPKLKNDTYVLGLKLGTAGAAAGNIGVRGQFVQG